MAYQILGAFLDGFTGGSLFTPLSRPGAPTQVFADEESKCPQTDLLTSLLKTQEIREQNKVTPDPLAIPEDDWRTKLVVQEGVHAMYDSGHVHDCGDGPAFAFGAPPRSANVDEIAALMAVELGPEFIRSGFGQQNLETVKQTVRRVAKEIKAEHGG